MAKFKRILLKLSGESLMGEKKYGIDEKTSGRICTANQGNPRHGGTDWYRDWWR